MSRLHRVVDEPSGDRVTVEDLDGKRHDVALLAYDGRRPRPGTWLVVHSGYALAAADEAQVAATLDAWRVRDPAGIFPSRRDAWGVAAAAADADRTVPRPTASKAHRSSPRRARGATMTGTTPEPRAFASRDIVRSGRHLLSRRFGGLEIAGVTAVVSGIAIFVNSYGVHAVRQAAVYTSAKNAVAAVLLLAGSLVARGRQSDRRGASLDSWRALGARHWVGLAYVGIVGGGVAFVLFFVGLAHTAAEPAAFLHDTLVLWVALMAVPFLGERISGWNVAAVCLLVGGQVAVTGGVGHLVATQGQALVLAATVLWSVETVVAKRLLAALSPAAVANARMSIGAVVLLGYLVLTHHIDALVRLDAHQLGWIVVTGSLLAVYVATWMAALARARAIDVASVLAASVIVTSLLDAAAGHRGLAPHAIGLVLVAVGTGAVVRAWPRQPALSRPRAR